LNCFEDPVDPTTGSFSLSLRSTPLDLSPHDCFFLRLMLLGATAWFNANMIP
jgi:hypothetical protein